MRMRGVSQRQRACRLIALQMLAALIVAAAFWLNSELVSSISVILGGLAAVLPGLFFTFCFFAAPFARQVERIIKVFYWGEVIKLLSSAALMIAIPKIWPSINLLAFFTGFAIAYLMIGWAPLIVERRR
jgi:ATP synthase protein I